MIDDIIEVYSREIDSVNKLGRNGMGKKTKRREKLCKEGCQKCFEDGQVKINKDTGKRGGLDMEITTVQV